MVLEKVTADTVALVIGPVALVTATIRVRRGTAPVAFTILEFAVIDIVCSKRQLAARKLIRREFSLEDLAGLPFVDTVAGRFSLEVIAVIDITG